MRAFRSGVARDDRAPRETLGPRGADEILAQHLEETAASHPRHDRRRRQPEGHGGQDVVPPRCRARGRQEPPLHGKDEDQQEPQHERRGGQPRDADGHGQVVHPGSPPERGHHAQEHAHHDRDSHAGEGQRQRDGQARPELLDDRRPRHGRPAEVKAGQAFQEAPVLDRDGPVETELLPQPRHDLRGGLQPGDRLRRVAGQQAHHREHDERDQPQRGQRDEQPPPQVQDHRSSHAFCRSTRSFGVISTPLSRLPVPTMKCWE